VVLVLALLVACGKSGSSQAALPHGLQLLQQSGQAMGDVTSAHVDLTFGGNLCCFISSAQGDISRDGKANGSFVLGGAEYPFRLLKGTFYLKPPTGRWVTSPPPYDPTKLLDPTNGLPSILAKATAGTTQASESVGGVDAYRVAARGLEKTGFSLASMRGAAYRPADSLGALVAQASWALAGSDRALVTVYHTELDGTGHVFGSQSEAWSYQLAHVDKLAEQLASSLPGGTALYVTADHGMVDAGPDDKIDVDLVPGLRDGVALLGGEPRARHVYTVPGAAPDALATWQSVLGPRAWVASRDGAIDAGWFGPVDDRFAARIGDVVAAPAGSWALVATVAEPLESSLVGMHG